MFVSFCLGTTSFSAVCMEFQERKVRRQRHVHVYTMHLSLKIHAGRHPCLWCTIRADQLKQTQHERGKLPLRTLDSLKADYLRFETIGKGDIRQAKNFNNVIGPVFFNVPLSQVRLHVNTDCPFATYMPIMYKNAGESPRPPYNTCRVLSTVVPARTSLPST